MGSYTDVKNLIISNIKANGQREITGPILQDVLLNMLENSSRVEEITYSDLKALRDGAKLTPSRLYRITDYITTTVESNTKSARHPFDVIVLAISESELLEQAWAIQHEGDEYFANSNLSDWEIWYCLDNDTTRFAWADGTNGKGVIYRMIDEFGNDVPYDFKNIQFYRGWDSSKSLWSNTLPLPNSGVYCYTFSPLGSSSTTAFTDNSLSASNKVYSNVIKAHISSDNKQILNNNCFFGKNYYNTFDNNCFFNTFGNDCGRNTIGIGCTYITLCKSCSSNTLGRHCQRNNFNYGCDRNTLGNDCGDNNFDTFCYDNSFGDSCSKNTFVQYCSNNTFGKECSFNSFMNNCDYNSFGNKCKNNSFKNYCYYNVFGIKCEYNTLGSYYYYNVFGNDCNYNSFRVSASKTSSLKNYVYYNHFDDGCSFNVIWNSNTTSSTILLKNINVNRGVVGTSSSYNMINIDVLNSEQEINVNQIDEVISIINISDISKKLNKIIELSYSELVTLRNNGQLIPGQQYRIIDYITTTTQENTKSAWHQFDIIVTALDESTLSEEAQAIQNSNDGYFDDSNLSAWKIWYCLDNDTNRFSWAGDNVKVDEIERKKYDSSKCTIKPELINSNAFITPFNFASCVWVDGNNDGFAYSDDHIHHDISELIYEWGYFTDDNGDTQLCIYKSDADLYAEEGHPDYGDKYLYRGVVNVDGAEYDYWQKWDEWNSNGNGGLNIHGGDDYVYATTQRIVSNPEAYRVTIESGKGVIYRMIDEWNNDCPYDFKNIMFARDWSTIAPDSGLSGTIYCYTFSVFLDGFSEGATASDESVKAKECIESDGEGNFGNNAIRPYQNSGICSLNDIVFYTDWSNESVYHYENTFGNDCRSNSFGTNCYNNTAGNHFQYNTFRKTCHGNTFGNDCRSNSFGSACYYNTVGNGCIGNTFGNNCTDNTLGNECRSTTFGKNCGGNTFGDGCQFNTFGDECSDNSFGNDCSNNTFNSRCDHNTFGSSCGDNTFGANCHHNTFDSNCSDNTFGVICNSNTFGSGCQGNTFGACYSSNSFGNRCSYVKLASDSSATTKYAYYQNNHFGDGCQYILFKGAETASLSAQVQNYNFVQGLHGTSSAYLTIDGVRNLSYEAKVAKNSKGEIKIYCEADLIA